MYKSFFPPPYGLNICYIMPMPFNTSIPIRSVTHDGPECEPVEDLWRTPTQRGQWQCVGADLWHHLLSDGLHSDTGEYFDRLILLVFEKTTEVYLHMLCSRSSINNVTWT